MHTGFVSAPDYSKLTKSQGDHQYSMPYEIDNKQYMLLGKQLADKSIVIGEIDLSL